MFYSESHAYNGSLEAGLVKARLGSNVKGITSMGKARANKVLLGLVLSAGIPVASYNAMATDPANLQAGPVYITPTLDTKVAYIDNLFRSAEDEVDTWATKITPAVQVWLQNGLNTYSLKYKAEVYTYSSSHDDDYTDQTVNLDIHHEFNAKNTLNLFGEYYDGHEQRGTGLTDGMGQVIDRPVEYERTSMGGDYTFGGNSSTGRLLLAAKTRNIEYQNFRDVTQYRDRDQDAYASTFFWRVAPRTDALLEVRFIENEYDQTNPGDPFGSLDSQEYNYYAGVIWDATAKTSGSVRIGWFDRQYDSALRQEDDGFSWEVDVFYRPRSYSTWNFESRRITKETNGVGNAINTERTSLRWDHAWSARSSTELGLMVGTDEYTGSERDDDRFHARAVYYYAFRRWFDLGIGYRYEDRDSSVDFFDYNRNEFFLDAQLSL